MEEPADREAIQGPAGAGGVLEGEVKCIQIFQPHVAVLKDFFTVLRLERKSERTKKKPVVKT